MSNGSQQATKAAPKHTHNDRRLSECQNKQVLRRTIFSIGHLITFTYNIWRSILLPQVVYTIDRPTSSIELLGLYHLNIVLIVFEKVFYFEIISLQLMNVLLKGDQAFKFNLQP